MPQPDSSRERAADSRWTNPDVSWPVDPAAQRRFGGRLGGHPGQRSREKPEQDGRTPHDPDGNEELKRELEEKPPSPPSSERPSRHREASTASNAWRDFETEDTSEWVATERFTLDDELEDTWPNVPPRYLDD
jgi:hypothetical protein